MREDALKGRQHRPATAKAVNNRQHGRRIEAKQISPLKKPTIGDLVGKRQIRMRRTHSQETTIVVLPNCVRKQRSYRAR